MSPLKLLQQTFIEEWKQKISPEILFIYSSRQIGFFITMLFISIGALNVNAQCTTSYNFSWDNGAGVGATWSADDVSKSYTDIGGSGINCVLSMTDIDNQNCDTGNPSTYADYTETTGGYGNDVLTWQMTSANSAQEVTLTFTFSKPIYLEKLLY